MRLVFMGTPDFAVPCLEHLIRNKHQVAAVYTRPDQAAGRGRRLIPSPVKKAAQLWHLPVIQPESLKSTETITNLEEWKPEAIVVAAYGQILPEEVLDMPPRGCINVHPSLLPRYRGASPIPAAVLAGDSFTGVSIMLMDAGMDSGPLLSQVQIAIAARDTAGSLMRKLSLVSARLLPEVLLDWERREITARPQDATQATYCGEISREDAEVDWRLPAEVIWRRVRAYQPWPGALTRWCGKQIKLLETVPLADSRGLTAGQVVAGDEPGEGFGITTGDGILRVLRVQIEGKRAMTATEFLRGQRGFIGSVLPS